MKLSRTGTALAAVAVGSATLLPLGVASADAAPVSFDAVASSYGFQSLFANPSIPTGVTLEGSGPVAQSSLNSLGGSSGFASFPYPGDVAVGFPAIANGLTGLPVPNYPFYVSSQYGSPQPEPVAFPGFTLRTRSLAEQSESSVVAHQASGFASQAEAIKSEDTVSAVADATFNALQIGPALTLSGVRSQAKAVLTPDGKTQKSSSLSVARFIAPGLQLTLPPTAPAPFAGMTLAAPELSFSDGQFVAGLPGAGQQKYAVPAETVFAALAQLGVKGTFQAAQTSANGVVSPTLTLETALPAPPENPLYNGPSVATYRVGLTSASIQGSAGTQSSAGTQPAPVGAPTTAGGTLAPVDSIGTGLPTTPVDAAAGLLPQTPTVDLGVAPSSLVQPTAGSFSNPRPGLAWFYLVLVGVAAAAVLAGRAAVGALGART